MPFTITSWNAEKLLTDVSGATSDQTGEQTLFENLRTLEQSDAIALSEAFVTSTKSSAGLVEDIVGKVEQFAQGRGYRLWHIPYDDADKQRLGAPPEYDHHMLLLGRANVVSATPVRLATRNAFSMIISEPGAAEIRGFAVHLDDRSSATRSLMTRSLLSKLNLLEPVVVAGDFNSMDHHSLMSRILRTNQARQLANHLPNARTKDIGRRLVEMADGKALGLLHAAGLRDAAPNRRSTVSHHHIPFGQLDHIMTKGLLVNRFWQLRLNGSSHVALSAKLSTTYRDSAK